MKVALATAWVGVFNGVLHAKHNEVFALDVVTATATLLNARKNIIKHLALLGSKSLNLQVIGCKGEANLGVDYIFVATSLIFCSFFSQFLRKTQAMHDFFFG